MSAKKQRIEEAAQRRRALAEALASMMLPGHRYDAPTTPTCHQTPSEACSSTDILIVPKSRGNAKRLEQLFPLTHYVAP